MRSLLLAALLFAIFTFGCFNYIHGSKDCGTDLGCFRDRIEMQCQQARVVVVQDYGTLSLQSHGPIWTEASDLRNAERCRVTVKVESVNETKIPASQKKMLSDYGIAPSTISLASMDCIMTASDFSKVYQYKDKTAAGQIYNTCSGTLKTISDQVPAIREIAGGKNSTKQD